MESFSAAKPRPQEFNYDMLAASPSELVSTRRRTFETEGVGDNGLQVEVVGGGLAGSGQHQTVPSHAALDAGAE